MDGIETNFSLDDWQKYVRERVIPKLTREQAKLVQRLLEDRSLDKDWTRLSRDVRPVGWPPTVNVYEAFHNIVGTIAFGPRPIQAPSSEAVRQLVLALKRLSAVYEKFPALADQLGGVELLRLPSSAVEIQRAIEFLTDGGLRKVPRPLMPISMIGRNASRNWLALYLRDRVFAGHFFHAHDDVIERLLEVALLNFKWVERHAG
jgi:hypothetical protein